MAFEPFEGHIPTDASSVEYWVKFKTNAEKVSKRIEKSTWKLQRAYLGMMFASMKLNKALNSMTKEMKRFGTESAFNILKMSIFAATISSPLFKTFRKEIWNITKAFLQLPKETRATLGQFLLLGDWLTKGIEWFGSLGLGVIGAKEGFSLLGIELSGLAGGGGVLATLGIAIAGIAAAILVWGNDLKDLKEIVSGVFGGVWKTIKGTFQLISGLITGDEEKILEGFKNLFNGLKDVALNIAEFAARSIIKITTLPFTILGGITGALAKVTGIKALTDISEALKFPEEWLDEKVAGFFDKLKGTSTTTGGGGGYTPTTSEWAGTTQLANQIGVSPGLAAMMNEISFGSRQLGGSIPSSGMYYLHKGEFISQKGEGRSVVYSPNIYIQASISSDYDIDDLVRKINDKMNLDFTSRVM